MTKEFTAEQINMMVKSARPINVSHISESDFAKKYADRVRRGKTKKDHAKREKGSK